MRILAYFALLQILAHQIRIQALKMALIGATIIMLAVGSMAATITVHAPDGEGRVFVDLVGRIEDGDFETFKQKTDQIEASHPKKLVIVTLMSYGGVIHPAMPDRRVGTQKTYVDLRPWRPHVCQRVRTHLGLRMATNRW